MHPTLPHTNVFIEGGKKKPSPEAQCQWSSNPKTYHANWGAEDIKHIPREGHTKKGHF